MYIGQLTSNNRRWEVSSGLGYWELPSAWQEGLKAAQFLDGEAVSNPLSVNLQHKFHGRSATLQLLSRVLDFRTFIVHSSCTVYV